MSIGTNNDVYFEYISKLNKIECVATKKTITKKVLAQLFKKLQSIQKKISQFEKKTINIDKFSKNLIKKIQLQTITLYGEIENSFYNCQMNGIKKNIALLKKTLSYKDFKLTLKIKKSLEHQIKTLLGSYAPRLQDRRVVIIAQTTISQAENFLYNEKDDGLVSEASLNEIEKVMEEFGEYFDAHNYKKIHDKWNLLMPNQQKLFLQYLHPSDVEQFLQNVEQGSQEGFYAFG